MSGRIGIVTGGGDCPGLNAVIRAVVKAASKRGGSPTHMDRALCTLYGTKAVELAAEGRFGEMVSFTGMHMTSVKLAEATGQLRTVPIEGGFVQTARALGVCLGD